MGIYIKGMRMPENCIKCPMQFGGMCYVMPAEVDESRVAPTVEEAWKQGKPDWCPLVEIPEPHWKLIDDNAMYLALAIIMAGSLTRGDCKAETGRYEEEDEAAWNRRVGEDR